MEGLGKVTEVFLRFWSLLLTYVFHPLFNLIFPINTLDTKEVQNGGLRPASEIPGPWEWPIVKSVFHLVKFGGQTKLLDCLTHLHKTYGPIAKIGLPDDTIVFVSDPDLFKEVIRSEPKCPMTYKLPATEVFFEKTAKTRGLFFQNGEEWYRGRQFITQLMLKETSKYMQDIAKLVEDTYQTVIKDWLSKIESQKSGRIETIEMDCYTCFLSAIGNAVYGPRFHEYLKTSGTDLETLADMAIKLNAATASVTQWPIKIAVLLGATPWKEYMDYVSYNLDIGERCTKEALKALTNAQDGGSLDDFGLLYRMKTTCNATEEDILCHCTDFVFDISDTVSLTYLWSLLLLGRNIEVQDKLMAEINSVCNNERPIVFADLDRMPYLNGITKEVQRLRPVSPLVLRKLEESWKIGGYEIPQGYTVGLSTFVTQHSAEYFPDPEKMMPERWMTQDGGKVPGENAFHPFGIGKRVCGGKLVVLMMLKLFIANMVQNFVIKSKDVNFILKNLLYPDGEIHVELEPRKVESQ